VASPRLSPITTCKGRLGHLKRTLAAMAAQPGCEVIVVDYDCPEGAGEWAERSHPGVKVARITGRPMFNISHARNLGAGMASASWLMFLDADVMVAPDFAVRLVPLLERRRFLIPDPRPFELWGVIAMPRASFEAIGGYDEAFEGWGAEDVDIIQRLEIAGLAAKVFPGALLASLPHGDIERTRHYAQSNHRANGALNTCYRIVKIDLIRLGAQLDLAARRQIYAKVRATLAAEGGPTTFKISFRKVDLGRPMLASLVYEFKDADLPYSRA
jgi:hypothetical protein